MVSPDLSIKMKRGLQGQFRQIGSGEDGFRAFAPSPLPPEPPLRLPMSLQKLHSEASLAVGRLDGLSSILPDISLILYFYSRKEAVLSSQIEGTQSTLSELLMFEADRSSGISTDVGEVSNYVAAMDHGLSRLENGFPLSLRLIREMHGILLRGTRGQERTPGEFRRSQNWFGGTRPGNALYVPPSVHELDSCLGDFEKFMHGHGLDLPPLLEAGLLHQQFETIHPFLDGNGRLGRLLVTLLLVARGVMKQPLLYPSLYLKQHRKKYYRLLQSVRDEGDWESWLSFFLEAMLDSADRGVRLARRILQEFATAASLIDSRGRKAVSIHLVYRQLQQHPYQTAPAIVKRTGLSYLTVRRMLSELEALGIVREVSGRARGQVWAYQAYLDMLAE